MHLSLRENPVKLVLNCILGLVSTLLWDNSNISTYFTNYYRGQHWLLKFLYCNVYIQSHTIIIALVSIPVISVSKLTINWGRVLFNRKHSIKNFFHNITWVMQGNSTFRGKMWLTNAYILAVGKQKTNSQNFICRRLLKFVLFFFATRLLKFLINRNQPFQTDYCW